MAEFLSEEGYNVLTVPKHQNAFQQVKETQPDIVICDLIFETMTAGWALMDMLFLDPATRDIPLILCSAATRQIQEVAPSLAAKGILWLEKPFELNALLNLLDGLNDNPIVKLRRKTD